MAWDNHPSQGELQPQLPFRCCLISWCFPIHLLMPVPSPWHWLFYYEVHYKGCFTCLQLQVEIVKILQLRGVFSLCEKMLLSKTSEMKNSEMVSVFIYSKNKSILKPHITWGLWMWSSCMCYFLLYFLIGNPQTAVLNTDWFKSYWKYNFIYFIGAAYKTKGD